MDTKKILNEKIDKLDDEFDKLIKDNKLDINSIESIALESVGDLKSIINEHIEELIVKRIDEKELINKKNKNGKKKNIN